MGPSFEQQVQQLLNLLGANPLLTVDGQPGPKTKAALQAAIDKYSPKQETPPPGAIAPVYPKPHQFHPRFEHLLPKPYTHLHPFDVLRSVAGEKEIAGSKDNPLIAHFHEHCKNLGTHSDTNDYSDEVAHCSSALNWAADMSGCRKTDNALASSWSSDEDATDVREGDWVEVGDIIHKRTGKQNHVTLCNKRFNRRTERYYDGFGSNQGNMIKTTTYPVADIISVRKWKPLPGTVLAPIGILGTKPVPATGSGSESTT